MKTIIGSMAAAALLAGGIGVAAAQTSPSPITPSAQDMQTKCWDEASKLVRDKNASGSGSASTSTTGSASSTTGSASSPNTGSTATGSGSSAMDSDRPAHARGLPECD